LLVNPRSFSSYFLLSKQIVDEAHLENDEKKRKRK